MSNIYPSFIDNKPSGKDDFAGKSHEKIAHSVSDHIIRKDSQLRVIGLEGMWGAGKSNIVEILRKELESSHHVYVYDAWGHQEDSQRRAFLEELTSELIDEKLLEKTTTHVNLTGKKESKISWEKKLQYLLSNRRITEKKTIPKLTFGIIVIGLVFVFTPIMGLLSNIIIDNSDGKALKVLFSASFILLAFVSWFVCTIYSKFRNGNWISLASVFNVYQKKELESETYETLSDLDPSVKEFKNWMQSISTGLKKDLIVVYDNMDRLPPEKVKDLWSSIHTFFAEEGYDRISLIIPFDREHLQKAFNDNNGDVDEFINKTFSIIYRVSPPVLTDWKDFFKKKYKEAFGETENIELVTVLLVFDRLKPKFTPRDIIVFINKLVALKRIWSDIPLRYIAVYAITEKKILENPQESILKSSFLGEANNLFFNDDKLQNFISALTYNIEVESASQVMLVRDLELVLRQDSSIKTSINEMCEHGHFIEVLENVVQKNCPDIEKTINTLSSLDVGKITALDKEERLTLVWNDLVIKQQEQGIENQEFHDNYKHLLLHSSKESKTDFLKYYLCRIHEFVEFDGGKYYSCIDAVQVFLAEKSIDIDINSFIDEKWVDPQVFIDYLNVAKSEYLTCKVRVISSKLETYLIDKLPNELPKDLDLSYLLKDDNYSFHVLREKLESIIEGNEISKENFGIILKTYKGISKDKDSRKKLNDNMLINILNDIDVKLDGVNSLVAMQLSNQSMNYIPQEVVDTEDEEIIKDIANEIGYYKSYGDLLLQSLGFGYPLFIKVCQELTRNNPDKIELKIIDVLPKFQDIRQVIGVTYAELMNCLNGWSKQAKENINKDNIIQVIPDFKFYEDFTTADYEITNHIHKVALEYISSLNSDELINQWGNNNLYPFNVLNSFIKNEIIEELPDNVFKALRGVLERIARSEIAIPTDDSMWMNILEKCYVNDITSTVNTIIVRYIGTENITSEMFKFFSRFFEEFGDKGKEADVTRAILTKVISNAEVLNHIIVKDSIYVPIINAAGGNAAEFKDLLLNKLKSSDSNSDLVEFAKKIGVEVEEESDEE